MVIRWQLYSGPGTVTFNDAAKTNSTVSFSAPGVYTLLLSADDGIHAVAYDAVVINITQTIQVAIARNGVEATINWTRGTPPYVVEKVDSLPAIQWKSVRSTNALSVSLPLSGNAGFFRVRGQ